MRVNTVRLQLCMTCKGMLKAGLKSSYLVALKEIGQRQILRLAYFTLFGKSIFKEIGVSQSLIYFFKIQKSANTGKDQFEDQFKKTQKII